MRVTENKSFREKVYQLLLVNFIQLLFWMNEHTKEDKVTDEMNTLGEKTKVG